MVRPARSVFVTAFATVLCAAGPSAQDLNALTARLVLEEDP
jgi:hypothetical protein